MRLLIYIFFVLLVLSSCKKRNAFGKIEIEAVDYYTGEGIKGVTYLLFKDPPGDLLKTKTVAKKQTMRRVN
jgi:hypothetical protein